LKMLAVCAASEARWEELLLALLVEFAHAKDDKFNLISKCGLDAFLWEQMVINFGYKSQEPNFKSLVIELFESSAQIKEHKINRDGIHVLKLMKDMSQHREAFDKLSAQCSEWIDAPAWLEKQSLETLSELDQFEYAERLIIRSLVDDLENSQISDKELQSIIQNRRGSHWYSRYETEYQCLGYASNYLDSSSSIKVELHSLESGFKAYSGGLYEIDQYYRKFCLHYSRLKENKFFEKISRKIENHYGNRFIFKLGTSWSALMQQQEKWHSHNTQLKFWKSQIVPYIQQSKKIFVIISDALRYEIAAELMSLIRKEDRFEAELSAMAGTLPSITSVGMAALLPHETISFDTKHNVLVDGLSSSGTENRMKIMNKYHPDRCLALRAEDVISMPLLEARNLYREYDVIYVYHDAIDIVGDKKGSEVRVFEAVETALSDLLTLVRKMSSANANNIIITAD
ncbi:MAG TPA: BREX-1 system phosphatase PglZ type A, partial [Candidatus Cloacimonadota bacterium]|nr:BREX-1 system phosphatase PglZ type A [Candidatus Cloacimonadota bacterium]